LINERFGLDQDGNPLSQPLIMGAHANGHVYFHRKTHSHRAHGDLETGPLLLSFVATVIDTNDWSEVLGIMESIRFEHHEDAQSGAADGATACDGPGNPNPALSLQHGGGRRVPPARRHRPSVPETFRPVENGIQPGHGTCPAQMGAGVRLAAPVRVGSHPIKGGNHAHCRDSW
jgi:hypothetical protein